MASKHSRTRCSLQPAVLLEAQLEAVARENWQQQRELADLRLLHASAMAVDDQATLAQLQVFVDRYQVDDAQLTHPAGGAAE